MCENKINFLLNLVTLMDEVPNIVETNSSTYFELSEGPYESTNDFYKDLKQIDWSSFSETIEGYEFTLEEIRILLRRRWLNDKIINAYFSLLEKHISGVFTFSTYFYNILVRDGYEKVAKWTNKINIFDYKYILIPIHLPAHWVFVLVDIKNRGIEYYDSLGGYNQGIIRSINSYLMKEQESKLTYTKFYFYYKNKVPRQDNLYDCGVFVCMFARFRSEGSKEFYKGPMRHFRLKILHELLAKKVIYDLDHSFK